MRVSTGGATLLAPGMFITVYGKNLGPEPWCNQPIPQNGPYPVEACGVRVLVGGVPAGLLFIGSGQINFKIPAEAPEEGSAPIQICAGTIYSQQVVFRFSTRKAWIRVQGQASVHMPVWIEVEQPMGYEIRYPYQVWPWHFGGDSIEVRHNGKALQPLIPQPSVPGGIAVGGLIGGSVAPQDSPRSRLPLHLLYRFDQPGTYSVRFTYRPRQTRPNTSENRKSIGVDGHCCCTILRDTARCVAVGTGSETANGNARRTGR